MSKPYIASSGHIIVPLTPKEVTKLNFGIKDIDTLLTGNNTCICRSCNDIITPNIAYYIPAINEVLCVDCCEDFIKCMKHYTDEVSIMYERTHYDYVKDCLNLTENIDFKAGKFVIE